MNGITTEIIAGVHIMPTEQAPRFRSMENPNLPLNSPEAWDAVFGDGYKAETGEIMTAERGLSIPAVWQAVNLISGDVAKMPLVLYSEAASGVRKEVMGNPLINLVQYQPNEDENAFKFWRRVMVHALIWNNAYVWAPYSRSNGRVEGLYHFLPDRTAMKRVGSNLMCVTEVAGEKRYFDAGEVIHIEGISHDCMEGADFIRAARNSWALALAQEKFASKFFKHGGRVGGILEIPIGVAKPARDTIEEGFRKSYEGSDNPFKTIILRDSAKFHAAQQSPSDAQLVEATEGQVRQIARWFNLSPSKLGLSDSVSYNSKAEDNQAYLDTTLSHWIKQLSMECTLKLLSESQRREMWFDYDTSELLRMNPLQRAQFHQVMIQSKIENPNEARRDFHLQPYEGGDKYENPNTSKGLQDKPQPPEQKPTETKPKRSIGEARIVFQVGYHARYKASNPSKFIAWIDGGLASHRAECQRMATSETIIDTILSELKAIAERCNGEQLQSAVDIYISKLEESYYES